MTLLTDSGLAGLAAVPYGTHMCHFYRDREDLAAAVVPYLAAGLRAGERCLWITDEPLASHAALDALGAAGVDVAAALAAGSLLLRQSAQFYAPGSSPEEIRDAVLREEDGARAAGYAGLRATGNVGCAPLQGWERFLDYEQAVDRAFAGRRILGLCSYPRGAYGVSEVMDVMHSHACTLERPGASWLAIRRDASAPPQPGRSLPAVARQVEALRARGVGVRELLALLVREAERVAGERATSSILLLDEQGLLRNGASPSLPEDYLAAIDGLKPDARVSTCAAAAATGRIVITTSFLADEKWTELKHLPMALGFVAAWSVPILGRAGRVLGTFGTYFRTARAPRPDEREFVEGLARIAGSVLEPAPPA